MDAPHSYNTAGIWEVVRRVHGLGTDGKMTGLSIVERRALVDEWMSGKRVAVLYWEYGRG